MDMTLILSFHPQKVSERFKKNKCTNVFLIIIIIIVMYLGLLFLLYWPIFWIKLQHDDDMWIINCQPQNLGNLSTHRYLEEGHSVRFLIVHSTMKVVPAAKLKRLEYDESELLSSPVVSCLRSGMSHEDSTASKATKNIS